jgi:hypothetical protein
MANAMFGVMGVAVSLFSLAGGLIVGYLGWRARDTGTAIDETATTEVGDLRPGRVALTGRVRPVSDGATVRSPIGRVAAVAYRTLVQQYSTGDPQSGGHWRQLYNRSEAVPFLVDDGTGTVRVDPPSDAEKQFEWTQAKVPPDEEPPPAIQSFVERVGEVDESSGQSLGPLSVGPRRRYSEGVLEPGENVYVLGRARETDADWDGRDYVVDRHAAGEFVISDKPPDRLATEQSARGTLYLAVGAIVAGTGVVGMLISLVFFL